MGIVNIDGHILRKFIISGANRLIENKEMIDSLNVFPVPDGDTGTNMSLTVIAAAKEVEKLNTPNISEVAIAASNGALRGARGNSGVILSQIFRGFAKGLENKDIATGEEVALALDKARQAAYKAVMKPKEGTILTIIKAISEQAIQSSNTINDIEEILQDSINFANEMLLKTPDMLPQLKQAGVVDSGGKGLICIFEGGMSGINADDVKLNTEPGSSAPQQITFSGTEDTEITFGYCTEFFILVDNAEEKTVDALKDFLNSIGDSIVVVNNEEIIKVHVHTNNPGKVLERALKIGALNNIKIDNMRIQHTNKINFTKQELSQVNKPKEPEKEVGFISVCSGDGLAEIFTGLGVDYIITGGQTMNPSTEDILNAIEKVNAKNVIILPNNKNIILAAEQAAEIVENKTVFVVPTKTVPQGITVMVNFMPDVLTVQENLDAMDKYIAAVSSGEITYAVRDTVVNDIEIKKGDYLCILENDIKSVSPTLKEGTISLIESMLDEDKGFLSIYYGQDATEEETNEIVAFIQEKYPDIEIEVNNGGQPVYYYIILAE